MQVLTLDAAVDGCSAGLVVGGGVVRERFGAAGRGQSALLPVLVAGVLAGGTASSLDQIAVTIGPGSFTGVRAALALAHGIALAVQLEVVGVTTGAALAAGFDVRGDEIIWVAIASRRGRVFLEIAGEIASVEFAELPIPCQPVVILGDAAPEAVEILTARGGLARLGDRVRPGPAGIARAARCSPRSAQPLYVDQPRTTLPT